MHRRLNYRNLRMVLSQCGTMVLSQCGTMVLSQCGTILLYSARGRLRMSRQRLASTRLASTLEAIDQARASSRTYCSNSSLAFCDIRRLADNDVAMCIQNLSRRRLRKALGSSRRLWCALGCPRLLKADFGVNLDAILVSLPAAMQNSEDD